MKFYLMRHGESEANVDHTLYQRKLDEKIELTKEGIEQAKEAGRFLSKQFSGDKVRIWTSPFLRAKQTTDIIYDIMSLSDVEEIDVEESIFLSEQQFGLFSGLTKEQTEEIHPEESEEFYKFFNSGGKFWARPPGGESMFDTSIRVKLVLNDIKSKNRSEEFSNLMVCHGTIIRVMRMLLTKKSIEELNGMKNPNNCEVYHIENGKEKGSIFEGFKKDSNQFKSYMI